MKKILMLAGCVAALGLSTGNLAAQQGGGGGGRWDPAQMRERMLDRVRDQLGVTDDAEWQVIGDAVGKVFDARMEIGFPGMGMMRGGRRGGNSSTNNVSGDQGGDQNRRRNFGTPNPEADALQKAIEDNAPTADIKAKLAALRDATKAREAKLEQAQDDLRKLLTTRQEANAVLMGLLK